LELREVNVICCKRKFVRKNKTGTMDDHEGSKKKNHHPTENPAVISHQRDGEIFSSEGGARRQVTGVERAKKKTGLFDTGSEPLPFERSEAEGRKGIRRRLSGLYGSGRGGWR